MNKFISITLLNTATSEISWNSKRWGLSEEQAIVSILISFSLIAIQEKESRSGRDVRFFLWVCLDYDWLMACVSVP